MGLLKDSLKLCHTTQTDPAPPFDYVGVVESDIPPSSLRHVGGAGDDLESDLPKGSNRAARRQKHLNRDAKGLRDARPHVPKRGASERPGAIKSRKKLSHGDVRAGAATRAKALTAARRSRVPKSPSDAE